jgi:hypothetical protein
VLEGYRSQVGAIFSPTNHGQSEGKNLKPIQTSSVHLAKWFASVCCAVSLFASKTALPADSLKKVRVAFPSIVIDFAPLWIAREKGLFREEGIDAEITYIQGGTRVVQALVSGDVNFGMGTATGAVTARAAGEGIITVAVPMNRLDYAFVSRQPISRPADLNGKKVGVAGVGGADNLANRIALESGKARRQSGQRNHASSRQLGRSFSGATRWRRRRCDHRRRNVYRERHRSS